jgi:carbonic anhydrase
VRQRVEAGRLELHGAYFGVATGVLLVRDPVDGSFAPVAEPRARRRSVGRAEGSEG